MTNQDLTLDMPEDTQEDDTQKTTEDRMKELEGKNLLEVLDEEVISRIVDQTKADRSWGKKYYESDLEPKYIMRQKAFRSDKKDLQERFPDLPMIVELSDSSVQDTVGSIMPSLMRIFHSAEKVLNLQGVTVEDDEQAETMEDTIDWQLNRKNNFWLTSYDWLHQMLVENFSVIKVWWKREETFTRHEVVFDEQELAQLQQDPKVQIELVEETNPADPVSGTMAIYHVKYLLRKRKANHPIIEGMPNSELYYDPDCKSLEEANFVIHHKPVTMSYLRGLEKQGKYVNVDKAKESAGTMVKSRYDQSLHPVAQTSTKAQENDPGRKEVILYECYEKISLALDENDPGDELVDLIVTLANDTPVRIEINTMGSHPFIDISAVREPHRANAHRGLAELVREIQDLRSILLLQMAYNTVCNNDRQAFVDTNKIVEPSELRNNEKVVQVNGNPRDIVSWTPQEPFSAQVMQLMEYCHQLLENRVGVTRYNQGSDANSLNKTLGGLERIMQAANQRIELIARICAETGYSKLFRRLIFLNQTFLDEETVMRVTNKQRIVRPDDLKGEIDIIVNSGIGTGTKQGELQSLQFILSTYEPLVAAGVATRANVAFVMGKILENMGFKNLSDFIRRPEELEAEDQQRQLIPDQGTADQGPAGTPGPNGAGAGGGLSPQLIEQLLARVSGRPGPQNQGA